MASFALRANGSIVSQTISPPQDELRAQQKILLKEWDYDTN